MQLKMRPEDVRWWFWPITLVFMIAALAGWTPGYLVVVAISAVQVIYFLIQEKSLAAFPTQVRVVYFAFTLFGLWPAVRIVMIGLLALGTFMVTFFGRCVISLGLKPMPWNRAREVRVY